jgi:ribosome-associated protein
LNSTDLANRISDIIFTKKGFNVLAIDLRNLVSFTDYFVICSADSDTQVKAIADEVDKVLSDDGIKCWHKEGLKALSWVLLDYVDVVVHVFKKDAREFYNLEKLWGDAPSEKMKDPLERTAVKAK